MTIYSILDLDNLGWKIALVAGAFTIAVAFFGNNWLFRLFDWISGRQRTKEGIAKEENEALLPKVFDESKKECESDKPDNQTLLDWIREGARIEELKRDIGVFEKMLPSLDAVSRLCFSRDMSQATMRPERKDGRYFEWEAELQIDIEQCFRNLNKTFPRPHNERHTEIAKRIDELYTNSQEATNHQIEELIILIKKAMATFHEDKLKHDEQSPVSQTAS